MEPIAKSVTVDTKVEPKNPYEAALFPAYEHALGHFWEAYQQCEKCGLADSEVASRGVIMALNKMLAIHLVKHVACQVTVPVEVFAKEIEVVVENIRQEIDTNFESTRTAVAEQMSKEASKQ